MRLDGSNRRGMAAGFALTFLALMTTAMTLTMATAAAGEAAVPAAPIPDSAIYTYTTHFGANYVISTFDNKPPRRVEFYITRDMGQTWSWYGEDPDAVSPMPIAVDGEGVYGLYSVATDSRGNREREPTPGTRPDPVIVVDRTPPVAQWIAPTVSTLTNPEVVTFTWESSDAHYGPAPVSIEVSGDFGRTWSILGEELGSDGRAAGLPANGTYKWKPHARLGSPLRFMLVCRDRAGNTLRLSCPAEVLIDNIPPTVRLLRPNVATSLTVPVEYEASDAGGSGLKEVALYATYDRGMSWYKSATDNRLGEPITFTARQPGRVGLMAVARDHQGNHSPLPYEGMSPSFEILIDVTKPTVNLLETFIDPGDTVPGGASRTVHWTASDDNELELNSAVVELSEDDGQTWNVEVGGRATSPGQYTVLFPNASRPVESARLRVTVRDRVGNEGFAVSRRFTIEAGRTAITDVAAPGPGMVPTPVTVSPAIVPSVTSSGAPGEAAIFDLPRSSTDTDVGPAPLPPLGTFPSPGAAVPSSPMPMPSPTPGVGVSTFPAMPVVPTIPAMPVIGGTTSPSVAPIPAPLSEPPAASVDPFAIPGIPNAPSAAVTADPLRSLREMATDPAQAAEALDRVNRMIDGGQATADLYVIQGYAYLTMRNLPDYVLLAAGAAAKAKQIDEHNPLQIYLTAEILLVSGRNWYDEIESEPYGSIAPATYEDLAQRRDDHLAGGRRAIEVLTRREPNNKSYLGLLGDILVYQGRARQQDAIIRGIMALGAGATPEQIEKARDDSIEDTAFRQAEPIYEEAARVLERAYRLPPANDYNNALMLGELYYRPDGLYKPALGRDYFMQALNAPDVPDGQPREAYYGLAMCWMYLGDYANAKLNFEHAQRAFEPDHPIQEIIRGHLRKIAVEAGY